MSLHPPVSPDEAGVFYVAYGRQYYEAALRSALSVRERGPWGIAVATNVPGAAQDDRWPRGTVFRTVVEEDWLAKRAKTRACAMTPFEYTLLLDADTLVTSDRFAVPFRYLGRWDLCLIPHGDAHRFRDNEQWARVERYLTDLHQPCYAGGVVYFRHNERVKAFFRRWEHWWRQLGKTHDSAALMMALWDSDVSLWSLTDQPWLGRDKAYILHVVEGALPGGERLSKLKPKHWDPKSGARRWGRT